MPGVNAKAQRPIEIMAELADLFRAKNADYGATDDPWINFREAEGLGVSPFVGCMVRKGDKWRRAKNLIEKGEENRAVKDESLLETLRDDVVYGIIAICLNEEEMERERMRGPLVREAEREKMTVDTESFLRP
jgi:hypothetical protein